MRLKAAIWVAGYLRRCNVEGAFAAVRRRGAEEAGAVYIKVSKPDGTAIVYAPAPQTAFDDAQPSSRAFVPALGGKEQTTDKAAEDYLAKQIKFDPDVWIVEVEDRDGRHFLDDQLLR